MNDLQQAAATARRMLTRVAADGGVLHQIETGERTPRDGDWEDVVAVVEALAERARLDRILIERLTQQRSPIQDGACTSG